MLNVIGAVLAASLATTTAAPASFPINVLLRDAEAARTYDYWRLREGRSAASLEALSQSVTHASRTGACQTDAEREIVTGLTTAAQASTEAQWRADRDAGANALLSYAQVKKNLMAGQPSGDAALEAELAENLAEWRQAPSPRAQAVLRRQVLDQLPMKAMLVAAINTQLAPSVVTRLSAALEQEECLNSHALSSWLKADVARRGWLTPSRDGKAAASAAWLITQHADHDLDFQKDVLSRLERLLPSGDLDRTHYAYLWDRVALNEYRPQRYGTQTKACVAGKVEYQPMEDPDHVDARRADMGMGTLAAYGETLAAFIHCHA